MYKSSPTKRRGKKRAVNSEYNQHIGTSVGGKNTKIHAVVDALGNPVSIMLSGRQMHESKMIVNLLKNKHQKKQYFGRSRIWIKRNNKIYRTKWRKLCDTTKKYKKTWKYDKWLHKERHLVEYFFNKLKQFRRIATRYDKLAVSFLAFVQLGAISILLR